MRKFTISINNNLSFSFFRKIFLLAALLCLMNGCNDKNSKSSNVNENSSANETAPSKIDFNALSGSDFFEISKSGCMFGCPYFKIRVNGEGAFEFQDFWYGTDRSPVRGKLSSDDIKRLFQTIKTFGFDEFSVLKIECKSFTSDRTTESMKLFIAEKKYSITYNMGCEGFENEAKLHQFEGQINSILKLDRFDHRKESH